MIELNVRAKKVASATTHVGETLTWGQVQSGHTYFECHIYSVPNPIVVPPDWHDVKIMSSFLDSKAYV